MNEDSLLLGCVVNYVVMVSVVTSQRDILLDPSGTNIWSGQKVQGANTDAVTWALAKYLYSPSGPYFIVPMGIFIGMVPTLIQRAIAWRWPNLRLGPVHINDIILPIIWTVRFFARQYGLVLAHVCTVICVHICWRHLHLHDHNHRWYFDADGMATPIPSILSQVQLRSRRCAGWRRSRFVPPILSWTSSLRWHDSHDLHSIFRRVRGGGYSTTISVGELISFCL